eukprot:6180922-Pleurochrysis_carterae.AAC.1
MEDGGGGRIVELSEFESDPSLKPASAVNFALCTARVATNTRSDDECKLTATQHFMGERICCKDPCISCVLISSLRKFSMAARDLLSDSGPSVEEMKAIDGCAACAD